VGSSCDDGDSCTSPDACDGAGVCVPGGPLTCDDGDFCNGAESCDTAGGCQPGTPPVLDDGVACTADACDEVGDVITHTPDSGFCDDGLFCNGIEVCDPVMDCVPGAAPDPDDGVVCTVDSCDEVGNVLVHVQDDGACDDGLWCNGAETCDALLDCQAGVAPSLDDGVGCTLDSCDEVADASVHTPDDGICDDSDPCTAESCDALLGCVTDPQSLCPPAVPVSRPLGLGLVALALLLLGSAWLALPRRAQASSPRSRPR
jgi:hypothetical protein